VLVAEQEVLPCFVTLLPQHIGAKLLVLLYLLTQVYHLSASLILVLLFMTPDSTHLSFVSSTNPPLIQNIDDTSLIVDVLLFLPLLFMFLLFRMFLSSLCN